jgi:hypothetical protein
VHVTTTKGGVLATPPPQSADNLFEFGMQPAGHAMGLCVSISVLEVRNQDIMLTGSLYASTSILNYPQNCSLIMTLNEKQ